MQYESTAGNKDRDILQAEDDCWNKLEKDCRRDGKGIQSRKAGCKSRRRITSRGKIWCRLKSKEENTQYQSMIRIKYMYENGNMEFIEVLADDENQ